MHQEILQTFANHLLTNGWVFAPSTGRGTDLLNYHTGRRVNIDFAENLFYDWHIGKESWSMDSLAGLKRLRIIPTVTGEALNPATPERVFQFEDGFSSLNLYRPFARIHSTLTSDNLQPYQDFMQSCFPIEDERNIVELWIAQIVQYPEQRLPWHILLTGTQGTGKGTLAEMLSKLILNSDDVSSFKLLNEMHSTHFSDNLLLHFNDIRSIADDQQDKLKAKLSDEKTSVRRMYQSAAPERLYTRVIYSSNERRPIRLASNERRWYCPAYMETKQNTKPFKDWLYSGGLNLVFDHLSQLDVSSLPNEAPHTATFTGMVEASRSMVDVELEEFLSKRDVFTMADLESVFGNNSQMASHKLTNLGYRRSKPFEKVTDAGGRKHSTTYWHQATLKAPMVREILNTKYKA